MPKHGEHAKIWENVAYIIWLEMDKNYLCV